MRHPLNQKGFTLIEMLVAVALFVVVMVVALGALLSISQANRKAESLKTVINNLNSSLDSMTRSIRTGRSYDCGDANCASGTHTFFTFIQSDGRYAAYCLDGTTIKRQISNNPISSNTCASFLPITTSEVKITGMNFLLIGQTAGDTLQPKLTVLIQGNVQVTASQKSEFKLQTSVTQRLYDL